jgi:ABC-type glycerol-3-phosphate transport system substrate-binding protein
MPDSNLIRNGLRGVLASLALAGLANMAAPAQAQPKITLTFVRAGDSATVAKVFDPIIKAFEAENPNIKIQSIPMGFDEANRRFPLMAATGQLPDVTLPPDSLSATMGVDDAFLRLENKLSPELVKDVPAPMWKFPCAANNGKLFGVPANAGALVLWYNVKVFKAAGLDPDKPPRTWDEFIAFAKTIKEKAGVDGYGMNGFARNDIMDLFGAFVGSRTGTWYWDEKKNAIKVDDGVAGTLDFMRSLVAQGVTQSSIESYNRADTRSLLRDGKVGMTIDGPWAIGALKQNVPITSPESNFRSAVLPGMTAPSGTSLNVSCYNIAAKTKNPEAAIKFVEFLSKPDNMLAHAQGYGVVPVRTSVLKSSTFAGQPWKALAESAVDETYPAKPGVANLSLVETTIPNTIQSVLLDKAKGMDALKALAKSQNWN